MIRDVGFTFRHPVFGDLDITADVDLRTEDVDIKRVWPWRKLDRASTASVKREAIDVAIELWGDEVDDREAELRGDEDREAC